MTDTLAYGAGVALVIGGTATVCYAVYLEMIRAVPMRKWDRVALLAPAGLVAIIGGLLLTR